MRLAEVLGEKVGGLVAVPGQLLKATPLPAASEAASVSHGLDLVYKRTQAVNPHSLLFYMGKDADSRQKLT